MPSGVSLERGFTSTGILLQAARCWCDSCLAPGWKGKAGLPLHTQGSTELTPEGTPRAEPPRAPVLARDRIRVPSWKCAVKDPSQRDTGWV